MKNEEIRDEICRLIKIELQNTNEFLAMLKLAEDNRTYAAFDYPSLYKWLTEYFGYSHQSALRRLDAVRVMRCVPEIENRLEQGALNLSTLGKAEWAFKAQEKATGERLSNQDKAEAIQQIENMSAAQAENELLKRYPEAAPEIKKKRTRKLKSEHTEHTIILTKAREEKLKRSKELLSHQFPDGDEAAILEYLCDMVIKAKDPLQKKVSAAEQKRIDEGRASKAHQRRTVLQSSEARCVHRYPDGHICNERFQIETDHIHSRARGGSDAPANLRPLCRAHNQIAADRVYGQTHMAKFRWKQTMARMRREKDFEEWIDLKDLG